MEPVCTVCGSSRLVPASSGGRDGELQLLRCEQCTFVFVPQQAADRVRHGSSYHSRRQANEDLVVKTMDTASFLAYWAAKLGLSRGSTLLDVGCAEGRLLQVARCMGYEAEGIDVTDYYREHWTRACLDASVATAEEYGVGRPLAFDVITARQVIEHVRDQRAFLSACASMLKPGGSCLIETGDPTSWQVRYQGMNWKYWIASEGGGAHVSFLGRRAATVLGERVGLRMRDSVPHFRYRTFRAYAREQGQSVASMPTLAKFALHRSRLSAARCYWFEKSRDGT
jgi:2-polyprenyl-6-hydroxyphenyl methylase / 3-demethylubiquinone-9 3-methyltransferase